MPDQFDLILADPPWTYRNVRTGGSHTSGSAQKYPVMSTAQIRAMPVKQLAARDAVLALWATTPLGDEPYSVVRAWGFEFKTKWYWHKVGRKGTGYWTRGEVEEVLIAVRGNVKAWRSSISNYLEEVELYGDVNHDNVIHAKPTGHSAKPPEVRRRLEELTNRDLIRRLELFATERPLGWTAYGLELDPAHNFLDPAFWASLGVECENAGSGI